MFMIGPYHQPDALAIGFCLQTSADVRGQNGENLVITPHDAHDNAIASWSAPAPWRSRSTPTLAAQVWSVWFLRPLRLFAAIILLTCIRYSFLCALGVSVVNQRVIESAERNPYRVGSGNGARYPG
jgi:hypothetical protein